MIIVQINISPVTLTDEEYTSTWRAWITLLAPDGSRLDLFTRIGYLDILPEVGVVLKEEKSELGGGRNRINNSVFVALVAF